MKRLLGLTFALTAGLWIGTAAAAEQERVRGTVVAISADVLTVHTATGDILVLLSGDTKYLTESRIDLNHIPTGSYVGAAAKNMGERQVALDILVFPPSMKGANEGHFDWDKISDTTLSGGARTSSSMTNGSVAAVAGSTGSASVNSTMTNGNGRHRDGKAWGGTIESHLQGRPADDPRAAHSADREAAAWRRVRSQARRHRVCQRKR